MAAQNWPAARAQRLEEYRRLNVRVYDVTVEDYVTDPGPLRRAALKRLRDWATNTRTVCGKDVRVN